MIIADVTEATGVVGIENVAELAPAGTVTAAGTIALPFEDAIMTAVPVLGAGPFNVTVPLEGVPPVTGSFVSVKLASVGGLTVNVAVRTLVA